MSKSNVRTLVKDSDGYYRLRVPPAVVDLMDWENGEKLEFNFLRSGSNAGNLRLESVDDSSTHL